MIKTIAVIAAATVGLAIVQTARAETIAQSGVQCTYTVDATKCVQRTNSQGVSKLMCTWGDAMEQTCELPDRVRKVYVAPEGVSTIIATTTCTVSSDTTLCDTWTDSAGTAVTACKWDEGISQTCATPDDFEVYYYLEPVTP